MADLNIGIDLSTVLNINISTSKSGYNYAYVVCKIMDDQYFRVEYEWEKENIPDFVLELMGVVRDYKLTSSSDSSSLSGVMPGKEKEYEEYLKKYKS